MSDLISLYSDRILALAADIPHHRRLDPPCLTGKARSPLCGSTITVDLRLSDGKVAAFGQNVKACALGQAAASVIGAAIIGEGRESIAKGRRDLAEMLENGGPAPAAPWQGLHVLAPAAEFKNRHASILLCFDAAVQAIDSE